jgi:hypothetical protein
MAIALQPRLIRRRQRSLMIIVVGCAALLVLAAGCHQTPPTPTPTTGPKTSALGRSSTTTYNPTTCSSVRRTEK